jgi:hypothetical protein
MPLHRFERVSPDACDHYLGLQLLVEERDEMLYQQRNVLDPLAQPRHPKHACPQTVIERTKPVALKFL